MACKVRKHTFYVFEMMQQRQLGKINIAKVVNLETRFIEGAADFSAFAHKGNVRTEVVWGESLKGHFNSHKPICKYTSEQRWSHLLASSKRSRASVSWATSVYITNTLLPSCMCNWGWDFMCGREQISLVRVRTFENASPAATFAPTEPLNYGFMHECAGLP